MTPRRRGRAAGAGARGFVAIAVLCAAGGAAAQGAPLDAMRAASGGARWDTVRGLHIVADINSGGVTGRLERWEDVATGRYLERKNWPDHEAADGFDGVTPWHLGRSGIAYALGDVDAAQGAADEAYRVARAWWFPARHAATIGAVVSRADGGLHADVLSITPAGGRPFDVWLDTTTHLPARMEEQQAEDRVVTRFADYHDVDGLMLPFTLRAGDGGDPADDEVETVRRVDINPDMPDALFTLPPLPAPDIELPPGTTSVDVPFQLTPDNRIFVGLLLNGRTGVEAEFDSGGSLLLQPGLVTAAGLSARGNFTQGGGGEGTVTASTGQLDSMAIGRAEIHHPAFHSFTFRPDNPMLALVGLEVLQRYVVRFDFDRQVMTLTRPDAFVYDGKGAVIPFHFQDNQPEIKGAVDGIAGLFTIDTGSSGSLLLLAPFGRQYDLVARYQGDVPYSGRAVTQTHGVYARRRPETVEFFGADGRAAAVAHDPVTAISLQHAGFDANRDVSANIGIGLLKQFNLTFDYPRQRIILQPNHLYGQREVFNRAGLRLDRQDNAWRVALVYPFSVAAEAGLKPGDMVSALDGQAPKTLDPDAVRAKFVGPVGTQLRLRVGEGATVHEVVLTLRDLL